MFSTPDTRAKNLNYLSGPSNKTAGRLELIIPITINWACVAGWKACVKKLHQRCHGYIHRTSFDGGPTAALDFKQELFRTKPEAVIQ